MNVTINPQRVGINIPSPDMGVQTDNPVARYVIEPYMTVEETEDGAFFTVTAQGETTTATVHNGEDGVSPLVSVSAITGGHEVAITGAEGTHTFDVLDGVEGQRGPQGERGPAGSDGSDGVTFTPSVNGDGVISWTNDGGRENPASVNIRGPQGERGPAGETGPAGATGPAGPAGPAGATGATGATGTTFTPSVNADGDLFWTNDGGKPNPATVNIKGPQGPTGPAGTTDYNDLQNKPTIPSKTSELVNDSGFITSDTKVEQMAKDPASWTYWRPLVIGYASSASEGFTPTDQTNSVYAFKSLSAQPSTGTIRAGAVDHFNGSYEAKVEADTLTADRTAKLPDKSGTIAMTGDIPTASTATPQTLGTASAGSSGDFSRADHVHAMPDASDVGALADTTKYAASPSVGGPAAKSNGLYWGKVDSTSTATAFTATVPALTGVNAYYEGLTVILKNGVVASTTNCTLNVNGLGALPIYPSTSDTRISSQWAKAYTMIFVYTETKVSGVPCWEMQYGMAYSNTIGYQLRTNSYNLPVSDACYRYRLLFTSADGKKFVPANASSSTNATSSRTTNTRPIDPFGPIVYYGSTTALASGGKPGATIMWKQYTLVFGYSFNNTGAALNMTYPAPVYLRCTPQADGSAVMDYFVQALPSTEDGKIYILLGYAYDATHIELIADHPVYYYKDGAIRRWTNAAASSGLPAVSASDNGKVLQVVNGAWAAASLPSANGVNF